ERDRRGLLNETPARNQPGEHHSHHERYEREPAKRRHQHRATNRKPAAELNVVAEKSRRSPLKPARSSGKSARVYFNFRNVVVGTDGDRAQRAWMRVGGTLVIHRHVEE